MPSVTFDPGVLAPPDDEATDEQVESYVTTLVEWERLLKDRWIKVYMTDRASEVLSRNDLFPLRPRLKSLLEATGVAAVYSPNTVAVIAERLLSQTPSFEERFGLREVLSEDFVAEPDLLSIHNRTGLVEELKRCMTLLAILRDCCHQAVRDHALVVEPWKDGSKIRVRAVIYELDHCRCDVGKIPQPPESFEGTVLVCEGFRDFLLALDEEWMLLDAQDAQAAEAAIRVALYRKRCESKQEVDWIQLPTFFIGDEFLRNAKECCGSRGAGLAGKMLRAIVETIERENLGDTHSLRESAAGDSPQQVCGKFRAMRRDIDHEYHLHYWQGPQGTVEIGSVGPHNDFHIPPPTHLS